MILFEFRRGESYSEAESRIDYDDWSLHEPARKVLRLTEGQSDRLFYVESWPEAMVEDYYNTKPESTERAEVTCKRIDLFIKSGGKE